MSKKHKKQVLLRPTQGAPTLSQLLVMEAKAAVGRSTVQGESSSLVAASKNPGPELRGRNDPLDAELYVVKDAELAASELLHEGANGPEGFMGTEERRPIETLFDRVPEGAESYYANGMYEACRDAGLWFLGLGKQIKLRSIAIGNDALDRFQKAGLAIKTWKTRTHDNLLAWAIKADAQFKDWVKEAAKAKAALYCRREELRPVSKAVFNRTMDELKEDLNAALSRIDKRMSGQVEPDELKLFAMAIIQGRKTNAVALYRKLTGVSLLDAKDVFEDMVTA